MSMNARRNHGETSNGDTCTFAGFPLDTRRQLLVRGNDRTMAFLKEAERERSQPMNWLVPSPAFDGVRTDPRFAARVRHLGLAQ